MTTISTADTAAPAAEARTGYRTAAIASILGAVALNAVGVWGDGNSPADSEAVFSFFVVCGLIAVAGGVVFGWLVPRGLKRTARTGRVGAGALVLSVLALLVVVPAFWSGLPPVLAAGGIVLGLAGRGRRSGLATASVVVGLLALVADVAVYVLDFLHTNGMM